MLRKVSRNVFTESAKQNSSLVEMLTGVATLKTAAAERDLRCSSLDTESERRFQENLRRISKQRTTFIIAHRLSTVRNASCILVLDKGVIVEHGAHEELMQQQGLYYHLAQQQLNI
jgi:ABC-type bacteriocin/lantibiotic exporter with double-glycine peptidase domain